MVLILKGMAADKHLAANFTNSGCKFWSNSHTNSSTKTGQMSTHLKVYSPGP